MKASETTARYEVYCPRELFMEGDISGPQIGTLDKDVNRVMIMFDVREMTVAEVIGKGVDLIIVKRVPVLKPPKNLVTTVQNQIYLDLVRHDIAVYASYTNTDIMSDGLNDWFCELLEITDTDILTPIADGYGIGRIRRIKEQTFSDLVLKVRETFHSDGVCPVARGNQETLVNRVAICGGSGQGFYRDATKEGAQVYIIGDIYYHIAQGMIANGMFTIDPGHHIEVLFTNKLVEKFNAWEADNQWNIDFIANQVETNPFYHLQQAVGLRKSLNSIFA